MATYIERQSGSMMNGNAIWLTCRECGHTSRVLALLASRVLRARPHCPGCASMATPCLNSTPMGTAIALSEEQGAALREMDDPALHALLLEQELQDSPLHWVKNLPGRVADRFSRRHRYGAGMTTRSKDATAYRSQQVAGFPPAAGTITPTGTAVRL